VLGHTVARLATNFCRARCAVSSSSGARHALMIDRRGTIEEVVVVQLQRPCNATLACQANHVLTNSDQNKPRSSGSCRSTSPLSPPMISPSTTMQVTSIQTLYLTNCTIYPSTLRCQNSQPTDSSLVLHILDPQSRSASSTGSRQGASSVGPEHLAKQIGLREVTKCDSCEEASAPRTEGATLG
jgi:hypothetical protein